ncbi:MAG: hypothetical protein WCR36_10235 [Bacteroidaceae bacterium]
MKVRNLLFALAAVCVSVSVSAQPAQPQRASKMKSNMTAEQRLDMKANMVASKLMLTDSEKPKFLTTYKSFLTELQKTLPAKCNEKAADCKTKGECKGECASCKAKGPKAADKNMMEKMLEGKTDAEVSKMIEDRMAMQQAKLDINKSYYKTFSSFLTPKQVACALSSANNHRAPNNKMQGKKHPKMGSKGNQAPQDHEAPMEDME